MSCEEIRNLLPAYTLGTATANEIRAVEDHLASCELHDDVAALEATAALIATGVEPVAPPVALKSRIMAHAAGTIADVPAQHEARRQWWFRRLPVISPIAAVLVVALGLMIVWNITLQSADPSETFVHFYLGEDSDWLRIETTLGDSGADVSLGGIERLDDSQLYHLWTTRNGQVLLVGAFNVNPEGKWSGEFDFTFEEGDRVWMTPEPASGSDQPTGEAVFKTRF